MGPTVGEDAGVNQTADTNVYTTGEAIIIPPTDADRALTHRYQPKSVKTTQIKQKDVTTKSQHTDFTNKRNTCSQCCILSLEHKPSITLGLRPAVQNVLKINTNKMLNVENLLQPSQQPYSINITAKQHAQTHLC